MIDNDYIFEFPTVGDEFEDKGMKNAGGKFELKLYREDVWHNFVDNGDVSSNKSFFKYKIIWPLYDGLTDHDETFEWKPGWSTRKWKNMLQVLAKSIITSLPSQEEVESELVQPSIYVGARTSGLRCIHKDKDLLKRKAMMYLWPKWKSKHVQSNNNVAAGY